MVIYDIPLLFENRHNYHVDYIIVATAAGGIAASFNLLV
jgi:dephospho-CoA kinase